MGREISGLLLLLVVITIPLSFYSDDIAVLSTGFHVKFLKSTLSTILLFLLFTYVGYPIVKLAASESPPLLTLFASWNMGVLIFSLVLKLTEAIGILDTYTLAYVLLGVALIASYVADPEKEIKLVLKGVWRDKYLRIVIILSLLPTAYLRYYSPFPWMLAYDQFAYSGIALSYTRGQPMLDLYPGYHTALSLTCSLTRLNPIFLYWIAPFFIVPLYVLGLYEMGREIFGKEASVLACLLAPWFNGWGWASDPYTFAPRTFLFASFPYILLLISRSAKEMKKLAPLTAVPLMMPIIYYVMFKGASLANPINLLMFASASLVLFLFTKTLKKTYLPLMVVSLASLTLLHIVESSFPSALLLIYIIATSLLLLSRDAGTTFSLILTLFFALFFFSDWIGFSTPITDLVLNIGRAPARLADLLGVGGEGPSSEFKRTMLIQMYTPLVLVFSLAGMALSLRNALSYPFLLLTSSTFYITFLPWKWPARIVNYLTTMISPYAGLGIYKLLHYLKEMRTDKERRRQKLKTVPREVRGYSGKAAYYLVAAFLVLVLAVYVPVSYYAYVAVMRSNGYTYQGHLSHFTLDDLKISEKILEKGLSPGDVIITDPMTKRVVEGLTGLSLASVEYELVKRVAYSYSYPLVSKAARNRKVAIALTGRTLYWLRSGRDEKSIPAIPPYPVKFYVGLNRLIDSNNTLELLTSGPNGYLFLAKNNVTRKVLKWPVKVNGKKVNAVIKYYDKYSASSTLTLTGSEKYLIAYPKTWVFKSVKIVGNVVEPESLKVVRVDPELEILAKKDAKIEVRWKANLLLKAVGLRVHGPSLNKKAWTVVSNATRVVYRLERLGINSTKYPFLIMGVKGESNTLFRVHMLFEDGKLAIIPSSPLRSPEYESEFVYKYGPHDNKRVVAITVEAEAYPVSKEPPHLDINYLILANA